MSKKVLVIEDFRRVREVLDIFLIKAGFSVFSAANGKDGLVLAEREKPDLMLIDSQLPDLDGMEVIKRIRAYDKGVKLFLVSGLYAEDLEKEALDNGATGFLSKSLGVEAIVKAVCDILA